MNELSDLNHHFWDIPKFVNESLLGFNPINKGFFEEHVNDLRQCFKCRELFSTFHRTTKHTWCPWCFVKHHCTIYRDDDKIIITLKYSGKEIFNFTQLKDYREHLSNDDNDINYKIFSNSIKERF